jgi:DNA-binding response OmpR family regulator
MIRLSIVLHGAEKVQQELWIRAPGIRSFPVVNYERREWSFLKGRSAMHRILIVDDEPNIILALELLMKRQGYEVLTVDDGRKALDSLAEFRPDLILLDIMMPKMDGYEVCQRIRADASLADVPVIMLTAKGREVEREKGLALGADCYITKPFSTREVIAKVQEILAARAGR